MFGFLYISKQYIYLCFQKIPKMKPKIQTRQKNNLEAPAVNHWKTAIDDTPGNTTEKLKELASLPGLTYDKVWRIYNGDTPDLRSSDAIKVLIKLNELRKGKMPLLVPQEFFLALSVRIQVQNKTEQ